MSSGLSSNGSHLFTPAQPPLPPPPPPPQQQHAAAAAGPSALLVGRLTHLAQSHGPASRTGLLLSSLLHSLLLPLSPSPSPLPAAAAAAAAAATAFSAGVAGDTTPFGGPGPSRRQQQQQQPQPPAEDDHTGRLLYGRALLACGQPGSALHLVQGAIVRTGEAALVELGQDACRQMGRWREGAWLGEVGRKAAAAAAAAARSDVARPGVTSSSSTTGVPLSGVHLTDATASASERQAAQHLRQATLHHRGNEPAKAVEQYARALATDPLCWDAFEGLCELGHPFELAEIFPPLSAALPTSTHTSVAAAAAAAAVAAAAASASSGSSLPASASQAAGAVAAPSSSQAYASPSLPSQLQAQQQQQHLLPSAATAAATTPLHPSSIHNHTSLSFANLSLAHPSATGSEGVGLPPASKRPRGINGGGGGAGAGAGGPAGDAAGKGKGKPRLGGVALPTPFAPMDEDRPTDLAGHVRRSTRLSVNGAATTTTTTTTKATGAGERRSKTLPKRRALSPPSSAASDASFQEQAALSPGSTSGPFSRTGTPLGLSAAGSSSSAPLLEPQPPPPPPFVVGPTEAELLELDNWLVGVLRLWGRATYLLSRYRCREAIAELDGLPKEVIRGNVEACLLVGRCWFETIDYIKAKRAFAQARLLDPYRLRSMDVYSTLLWHLHDEVGLSSLAHDLLAISRTAPESWVALGNCFSLQKEPDEAMRCFRRASQLEPAYAYAHTLSGHEAVSMEEYDRALAFFQTAVRIDKRHFNAWYGLGTAYLRKNKYRQAEHSFRRAVEINPENAVLICCVGQVLERRGRKDEALQVYEQAFAVDPESPMVAFRRAKALASMDRFDIALPALQKLVVKAPNEFQIHFLLGKIYTRLKDPASAMRSFAYALDLDPSMGPAIKAAQLPREPAAGGDDADDDGSQMTEGAGV